MATEPKVHRTSTAEDSRFARPARRLPAGRLRLPRGRPLREAVLAAFRRALVHARRAARSAGADPVHAVHEYRKSLRRSRAVVALLSPALGRRGARGLRDRLQAAFAATGPLRDASVLRAALDALRTEAADEESARGILRDAFDEEERRSCREAAAALARGLPGLRTLPAALEVLLEGGFSARDLERGLLRLRRRERRAYHRSLDTRDLAAVHEWRKRVKELRYAIELLASTGTPPLKSREKRLAEFARDLGAVTDATVLSRELTRRIDGGEAPAGAEALRSRADSYAAGRAEELLTRGATLFEDQARDFARRVVGERG